MCRTFKSTNLDPGGFAEFVRLSADHVEHVTFPIGDDVSFGHAAMIEPLACILRNLRRIDVQEGDTVVVVGLGFIGLMTALALREQGATVLGLDIDTARVRGALKQGFEHCYTGKDGRTEKIIAQLSDGRGADALISTAGGPDLLSKRLSWVRDGGVINVFAGFGGKGKATFDLDEVYHRELTVLSSYSPALEDLAEAHRLITEKRIDVSVFVQDTFPLEQFDEALRRVRGREILKAVMLP